MYLTIFANTYEVDYYLRTYPKIQDVIAKIEGLSNWIFYVTTFISLTFSENLIGIDIFNSTIKLQKNQVKQNNFNYELSKNIIRSESSSKHKSALSITTVKLKNQIITPKRKKITFESYTPACLIRDRGKKKLLDQCEEFYSKLLSAETIVNSIVEVDKLKRNLFESKELD